MNSIAKWGILLAIVLAIGCTERVQAPKEKKVTPTSVRVVEVKKGAVSTWVVGEGIARAVRREILTFERDGKVVFIGKDKDGKSLREGSLVRGPLPGKKAGQLLAEIDKREELQNVQVQESQLAVARQQVSTAQVNLQKAKNEMKLAKVHFVRSKNLKNKGLITDREFEEVNAQYQNAVVGIKSAQVQLKTKKSQIDGALAQLNQAKLELERTAIFAPFDGVITYFNIKIGDFTAPSLVDKSSEQRMLRTAPIVLIDPSEYEVTLELPAYEGIWVKRGQKAIVTWAGFDILETMDEDEDKAKYRPLLVDGEVYSVNPAITPGGRAVQVKVRTKSQSKYMRDGLYVTSRITLVEKPDALIVPANAIIYRKSISYAFVVNTKTNSVERRKVQLGISSYSSFEVVSGIKLGEKVVTEGQHRLVEGSLVKILQEKK